MLKDVHNRLRPLGIADILDETIDLYKSNFVLLVGIAAFLYVPFALITAPLQMPGASAESMNPARAIGTFATFLVYMLFAPIVTGALAYGISERYLGRETSIGACYRRMLKVSMFLPLLGANILVMLAICAAAMVPGLAVGAGALLIAMGAGSNIGLLGGGIIMLILGLPLIVVPIYVAMRLALVAPSFVIETRGAGAAISRSWALMKGNALKAFAVLFIVGAVVALIQLIVTSPIAVVAAMGAVRGAEPSGAMTALFGVLQAITSTLLGPLTSIVVILLYYDMRIRKEGFDLELLARDLEASAKQADHAAPSLPQEQLPPHPQYQEERPPEGQA